MPDYHLYDEYVAHLKEGGYESAGWFNDFENYSIGFTTRGCFRKCAFCVNRKYDRVRRHSHVSEFLDPSRRKIALWDDNILAYAGWEEVLDELIATGRPFCFRQGLDIRLMTEKKAEKLSTCRYDGAYTFAFDHIEDKDLILQKLDLWKRYNSREPRVYVLCGFDQSNDPDVSELDDIVNTLERVRLLMERGCLPYIMRHRNYKTSRYADLYTVLARWINQPSMFRHHTLMDYLEIDQKGKKGIAKSTRVVKAFAEEHPDVAERYFHLRYQ